ncbi:MAG: flagellar FlbD family protein [Candidatus Latescibacterota bacterium]|jgi:flagellar protein FlbD
MIRLTRLNDTEFIINAEIIEFVEAIPDTIISLQSGKKVMVVEPVDEVVERIIEYKRRCSQPLLSSVG